MDTYAQLEQPQVTPGEAPLGLDALGETSGNLFSRLRSLGQTATERVYGLYESATNVSRNVAAVAFSTGIAALSLVGGVAQTSAESYPDGLGHASAALTDASCAEEALQRPKNLRGRYDTYTQANNHWYREQFSVPSVANCTALGKRTVHYFQEVNSDGGWIAHVRTENSAHVITVVDTPNIDGYDFYLRTNKAKTVDNNFRSPHFCVNEGPGLSNSDKVGHTLGRATAIITWTPSDGSASSTKPFYGKASPICK
ncbi:MAG: hypothetical protein ACHQT9_01390 [Candidatus Saccharimonadales bacterium]